MPTSKFFPLGSQDEQNVLEDIIIEAIQHRGVDLYYIPRTIGSIDVILHEDRLSEFNNAYPIEGYFENITGFEGDGSFLSKFGLQIEQQMLLTIARRRWEQLIGRFGKTVLPQRPAEGDLMYFPLTKGLFEIKFVEYLNPFFQLGRLYVYKLKLELFQYTNETINTGIPEIDTTEISKTLNLDVLDTRDIELETTGDVELEDGSGKVLVEPETGFEEQANNYPDNEPFRIKADENEFNESNPFGEPLP